jgi:ActD protein
MSKRGEAYGILAEFGSPEDLLAAARRAREAGYDRMDAFTPFPVEGLAEELGFRRTSVPLVALVGGILGATGGYFLQYFLNVRDYPINVGGRPLHSVPMFMIVTFELTILVAALFAVLGMLALNRLPMPYHPVFNVPDFALASTNRFFLVIETADPQFDRGRTRAFLQSLTAKGVWDVET